MDVVWCWCSCWKKEEKHSFCSQCRHELHQLKGTTLLLHLLFQRQGECWWKSLLEHFISTPILLQIHLISERWFLKYFWTESSAKPTSTKTARGSASRKQVFGFSYKMYNVSQMWDVLSSIWGDEKKTSMVFIIHYVLSVEKIKKNTAREYLIFILCVCLIFVFVYVFFGSQLKKWITLP